MATLHKEYTLFNKEIELTKARKNSLINSRNSLKDKIKKYFKEEKEGELQPTFKPQGSFVMRTTVNPIPIYDDSGKKILKYDLDYGIYFEDDGSEDNKKSISTWHNWVYNSVKDHTGNLPKRKNTCVRVIFSDGHHVDLPIYYKENGEIELAHKTEGWIESAPKEFSDWFNEKAEQNKQLRRIVRYFKAWKNFKEINNKNLKFPSGFALTILATENFTKDDNDDKSFKETVSSVYSNLKSNFQCLRPTTPINEDIFKDFSETRKNNFLEALKNLVLDCDNASEESNFKKASEYLRKHFGDRFPLGNDESENSKSKGLDLLLGASIIKPKPFSYGNFL